MILTFGAFGEFSNFWEKISLPFNIYFSGPDNVEIIEPDSEESSIKDIPVGQDDCQDVCEKGDLEEKENEKPSELLIPITLENGDVLMPKFSELDELVPPKWSIFYRSCSDRNVERLSQQRSSINGTNLPSNSKLLNRFFLFKIIANQYVT